MINTPETWSRSILVKTSPSKQTFAQCSRSILVKTSPSKQTFSIFKHDFYVIHSKQTFAQWSRSILVKTSPSKQTIGIFKHDLYVIPQQTGLLNGQGQYWWKHPSANKRLVFLNTISMSSPRKQTFAQWSRSILVKTSPSKQTIGIFKHDLYVIPQQTGLLNGQGQYWWKHPSANKRLVFLNTISMSSPRKQTFAQWSRSILVKTSPSKQTFGIFKHDFYVMHYL